MVIIFCWKKKKTNIFNKQKNLIPVQLFNFNNSFNQSIQSYSEFEKES